MQREHSFGGSFPRGGWDYQINFDKIESKQWHYRRDVEADS